MIGCVRRKEDNFHFLETLHFYIVHRTIKRRGLPTLCSHIAFQTGLSFLEEVARHSCFPIDPVDEWWKVRVSREVTRKKVTPELLTEAVIKSARQM